ncbi:COG complex component [Macleaya cordata]|uniref:COG complex component n=1 Tax=Macleaya cordata TaxID=56857 RepID=A0A200QI36_MACCD|nr:COG complex component [Macleaya cordata]
MADLFPPLSATDIFDFVNLSTKLVDVDGAILRMRAPLSELREKILQFRHSVESSLAALQNGLRQRAEASSAREVLELLLDTFHVVSKVEKLIKELPSVPTDWSNGDVTSTENTSLSNGTSLQHAENDTSLRETQSMLLERIASEMNRLKFYMTHAQNFPFIENMEKRIQSASLLLDASLGHCFVDGLEHRDANVIYNCLRAYAAIDNTTGAEEIFRTTIVSPLIQKIIPHGSSQTVGGEADDLGKDYQQLMQCIEKDCKFLLEISSTANSGLHVFDFLANSILKDVLLSIQKGKPGAFSPGRPTEFLKNYRAWVSWLFLKVKLALLLFNYVIFCVYEVYHLGHKYHFRFQEIAEALDNALTADSLTLVRHPHSNQGSSRDLTLKQSHMLLESLRSCWREDVLILSSSDKFLRLSLQLLSRYSTWLSSGLDNRKMARTGSNPGTDWAISAVPEDFIYVMHDIDYLVTELEGDYLGHVLQLFGSCPIEVLDLVKHSILQGGKLLKDLVPRIMNTMTESLVEKSVEDLRHLKGITATYRMTNKPLPVRHSPYVSGVLRLLKAFLEGEGATTYLSTEARKELLLRAAEEITGRYYELAADLVNVARKTESSLQRIRQGAQRRAGASSDVSDHGVSDTDKICMQLFLDIQEYGRNLVDLGVKAADIPAYCSLWQCVAPPDMQTAINF